MVSSDLGDQTVLPAISVNPFTMMDKINQKERPVHVLLTLAAPCFSPHFVNTDTNGATAIWG